MSCPFKSGGNNSVGVTYMKYLQVEELTSLQHPVSDHEDELLFITTHQHFELWFKQALFELEIAIKALGVNDLLKALYKLKRFKKIIKTSVGGFEILKTMRPAEFLEFRGFLGSGSGFQSIQFRKLEIVMGLQKYQRYNHDFSDSYATHYQIELSNLEYKGLSLRQAVDLWLCTLYDKIIANIGVDLMDEFIEFFSKTEEQCAFFSGRAEIKDNNSEIKDNNSEIKDNNYTNEPSTVQLQKARRAAMFIMTFYKNPLWKDSATVIDSIIKCEDSLIGWRQTHPRMVEYMIGYRVGTGGKGVGYLDNTQSYRIFTDLRTVATYQIPLRILPFELDTEGALKKHD